MSSEVTEEARSSLHGTPDQIAAMERYRPVGESSFKVRLAERFTLPGTQAICHQRTIFGTWKAFPAPFKVHNIGVGGLSFWNLGIVLNPGAKIKMTILLPGMRPISVVSLVVWSRDMSGATPGDGAQTYSQITGVKFVDYDAAAWAVLRSIPQIVQEQMKSEPPSEIPLSEAVELL